MRPISPNPMTTEERVLLAVYILAGGAEGARVSQEDVQRLVLGRGDMELRELAGKVKKRKEA